MARSELRTDPPSAHSADAGRVRLRVSVRRAIPSGGVPRTSVQLRRRRARASGARRVGEHLLVRGAGPELRVEGVEIDPPEVREPRARVLAAAEGAAAHLVVLPVPAGHAGLLFVDGVPSGRLEPGQHVYWKGLRRVEARVVDLRELGVEVQGQELLTADKVSLRLNLSVRYRVTDVERALLAHADHQEALHRCLQLALREEAQRLTLDELLSRKEDLGAALVARARDACAASASRSCRRGSAT